MSHAFDLLREACTACGRTRAQLTDFPMVPCDGDDMSGWIRVVFGHEVGPGDICPQCSGRCSECPCPGPTMEGWIYQWRNGVLWAREEELAEAMEDVNEQLGKLIYAGVAMNLDLAMVEGNKGQPVLHSANCPFVQLAREQDKQVFTLFGCQEMPDDTIEKHSCVAEIVARARSARLDT